VESSYSLYEEILRGGSRNGKKDSGAAENKKSLFLKRSGGMTAMTSVPSQMLDVCVDDLEVITLIIRTQGLLVKNNTLVAEE